MVFFNSFISFIWGFSYLELAWHQGKGRAVRFLKCSCVTWVCRVTKSSWNDWVDWLLHFVTFAWTHPDLTCSNFVFTVVNLTCFNWAIRGLYVGQNIGILQLCASFPYLVNVIKDSLCSAPIVFLIHGHTKWLVSRVLLRFKSTYFLNRVLMRLGSTNLMIDVIWILVPCIDTMLFKGFTSFVFHIDLTVDFVS